jgi:acyl-CoA synthetase (AMP-forming)/AMP-acid ligase II
MTDPCLSSLLRGGSDADIALAAPERPPLTYAGLRTHLESVAGALAAHGVGRADRIAIVLPNGPEMASAFLSIACAAATAPLNPAYRPEEFEFYLTDLGARALVLTRGDDTPARTVAERLGIAVFEIEATAADPAGVFRICDRALADRPAPRTEPAPDDVALLLHTSGTTSRPKLVPLTHANLTASAANIRTTLSLTRADCGMNIMPLFHIHGLVANVLAPLSAGGRIYCTPGFNALRFFGWFEDADPTWYSAVPTMHQAILARAARSPGALARHRLRFIRSSSAALPVPVLKEIEATFGVPLIEAYAMTEASHQMTSNPLPPLARKPGSVGLAAGPQIAVMGEDGALLGPEMLGEVVIRGANVTRGYADNPKANADAFRNGWFRTGDQGVLDPDGYLRITGRLKEIINRGGEKVSPLEVDGVLQEHPAVAQVVTFGVPHPKLGEEVAAAVVLKEGASADPDSLRAYATERLAEFKVPRRILILAEIPKGATGKLQRIGLAQKLGLA